MFVGGGQTSKHCAGAKRNAIDCGNEAKTKKSSVKNSQVLDLESRNGALWKSSLPGSWFAEGDSLQI
jgi:hypothetical protein